MDALNDKVDPREDIIVIEGMVGDSLDPATSYENVQSKILIDATTIPDADPRSDSEGPEGSPKQSSPSWRKGKGKSPGVPDGFIQSVLDLNEVSDARLLRPSMLVVTTSIEGRPDPRKGMFGLNEELAKEKEEKIEDNITMTCLVDPGVYRQLEKMVNDETQGKGQLELLSLKEVVDSEEQLGT